MYVPSEEDIARFQGHFAGTEPGQFSGVLWWCPYTRQSFMPLVEEKIRGYIRQGGRLILGFNVTCDVALGNLLSHLEVSLPTVTARTPSSRGIGPACTSCRA